MKNLGARSELLNFDKVDPEYAARLDKLSTAVEDKGLVLIQLLEDSRGALGLSHIAVQTFIGRQNLGVAISEKSRLLERILCFHARRCR